MTDQWGVVLDVATTNVGEFLTADAAAAATQIVVSDSRTFSETGGLLLLNGVLYTYTAVDEVTETLTLFGGLASAAFSGDRVDLYPEAPVKRALVDLGDEEGEAIWVIVPHSLTAVLADGQRLVGQQEAVLLEYRGAGELYVKDIPARADVPAYVLLGESSVDPDRSSVGTTGNLLQDPGFLGNIHQPPDAQWSIITVPDAVYPDVNFLRAVGTTTPSTADLPLSDTTDRTWKLTDFIPVDPGRAVRLAALVRRDDAATTGASFQQGFTKGFAVGGSGSGSGLSLARVRIVFYKDDKSSVTAISGLTQTGELNLSEDMIANTWTPITVTAPVPEGYVYFRAAVQVSALDQGSVDFVKPEVQVLWDRIQSPTYVEGESGFRFDERGAQVQNLAVLEEIGVDTLTARSITIDGLDLAGEFINLVPLGAIAYDSRAGIHTGNFGSTPVKLFEYSMGPSAAGRLYRIWCQGHLQGSANGQAFDLSLYYTADGSTPTNTSNPEAIRTVRINTPSFGNSAAFEFHHPAAFPASDNIRIAVYGEWVAGAAGTGIIYLTQNPRKYVMYVEDMGLYGAAADAGTLSQKSVASGSPGGTPVVTRVKNYAATWAGSYRGQTTGFAERPDGTTRLYQGVGTNKPYGNQRSLFGLPYATIQADLAGATIKKVTVTFRLQEAWGANGISVYLSSHNYTSKPSSFNPANVDNDIAHWAALKQGSTYTRTLANSVGDQLKSGSKRGFGFGPAPTTNSDAYYGYMYGSGASRPRIQITYSK